MTETESNNIIIIILVSLGACVAHVLIDFKPNLQAKKIVAPVEIVEISTYSNLDDDIDTEIDTLATEYRNLTDKQQSTVEYKIERKKRLQKLIKDIKEELK